MQCKDIYIQQQSTQEVICKQSETLFETSSNFSTQHAKFTYFHQIRVGMPVVKEKASR